MAYTCIEKNHSTYKLKVTSWFYKTNAALHQHPANKDREAIANINLVKLVDIFSTNLV